MKGMTLATMKSNNYLLNALGCTEAKSFGGHYGIWVDPVTDEVYEASVRNIVFVLKDGRMVTPPYIDGKILKGCTVRRIVKLAEEHLISNSVARNAIILNEIVTDQIVYKADLLAVGISEMFLVSGDTHLDPVTMWDDLMIGNGKPGSVFKALAKLLFDEAFEGKSPYHAKIEY